MGLPGLAKADMAIGAPHYPTVGLTPQAVIVSSLVLLLGVILVEAFILAAQERVGILRALFFSLCANLFSTLLGAAVFSLFFFDRIGEWVSTLRWGRPIRTFDYYQPSFLKLPWYNVLISLIALGLLFAWMAYKFNKSTNFLKLQTGEKINFLMFSLFVCFVCVLNFLLSGGAAFSWDPSPYTFNWEGFTFYLNFLIAGFSLSFISEGFLIAKFIPDRSPRLVGTAFLMNLASYLLIAVASGFYIGYLAIVRHAIVSHSF